MRLIFTGGHHTSGLLVAKEMVTRGHQVIWIGHQSSMARVKADSAEYHQVVESGIKFIPLNSGKPVGYDRWWLVKLFKAWVKVTKILGDYQPDLVVAWGGYLAVPVVIAGWLKGIPCLLHEQTRVAGRANRFLIRFAQRIMVAWPDVSYPFPRSKTVVVGLPLRFQIQAKDQSRPRGIPRILVLGGKQGSRAINHAVMVNLTKLLKMAYLTHQCGFAENSDDLKQARHLKLDLPVSWQRRYRPLDYLNDEEIGKTLAEADLVVSRAGVHIIQELLLLKKPALLIPLEIVPQGEQVKNAIFLRKLGLAEVLDQDRLETQLAHQIELMLGKIEKYRVDERQINQLLIDDPMARIIAVIEKYEKT